MATNTYVALDTKTIVGSSTSSITFTSIPQGYTDLVIVEQSTGSVAAYSSTYFNGNNTGTNYSWTYIFGTGGSALSGRVPNLNRFEVSYHSTSATPNTKNYNVINNSNSTTFKTMLSRYNLSNDGVGAYVGLWRQTSAITSITFESLSGTYTAGSTFTIYGVAAASVGAKATGGIISSDSQYYYHTFIGNGTFTPTQNITCDYVLVAGGGGGGAGSGGGGGAGGYRYLSNQSLTSSTNYSITVGGGGTKSVYGSTAATSGINSSFASTSATGGGRSSGDNPGVSPSSGGSGGGGYYGAAAGSGNAGSYSPVEGYAGGAGRVGGAVGNPYSSGGGGGASQVGAAGTVTGSGKGGDGVTSTINGYSVTYAGGGGGGGDLDRLANSGGAGGAGGGGAGGTVSTSSVGADGTPNTGGGGGGGANAASGGNGGSGIVIVRYAK